MEKIAGSELILHSDGSVYHLGLKPEQLADKVILVGDPQRVSMISAMFGSIECKVQNREMVTHTGTYKGSRFTVISTGMGTDNIDIVMNELDALVNVDLERREVRLEKKSIRIIRLGTSGALQKDIPLNSHVVSRFGLGLDGLLYFYKNAAEIIESGIPGSREPLINHWPSELPKPYLVSSSGMYQHFSGDGFLHGITATAPGFYGPQGRIIRLELAYPGIFSEVANLTYHSFKVLNFEMETSALYGLGKLLGHETLTICLIIANRLAGQFGNDYRSAMKDMIAGVLEIYSDIE